MNYFHRFSKDGEKSPVQLPFKRSGLSRHFKKMGLKIGAEIGVADGRHSLVLCKNIPDLQLYCIDPWDTYRGNPWGGGRNKQHRNYQLAQERLSGYNVHFVRDFSSNVATDWDGPKLDFVYIDGNHKFDFVMQDIILWSRLVRKGGVISGDDYYHFSGAGVVTAVNAYIEAHNIKEWFLTADRTPSWMWVK